MNIIHIPEVIMVTKDSKWLNLKNRNNFLYGQSDNLAPIDEKNEIRSLALRDDNLSPEESGEYLKKKDGSKIARRNVLLYMVSSSLYYKRSSSITHSQHINRLHDYFLNDCNFVTIYQIINLYL